MYLVEFRIGWPEVSRFYVRKWLPLPPQRHDYVRLSGKIWRVIARYIGMDDHVVLFLEPSSQISGKEEWVFPKKREYARDEEE